MKTYVYLLTFLFMAFAPVTAHAADLGYEYQGPYAARSVIPHGIYFGTPYHWRPPIRAWRRDYWVGPVYGHRGPCCLGARPVWGGPVSWGPRLHERPVWVGPRAWSTRRRW